MIDIIIRGVVVVLAVFGAAVLLGALVVCKVFGWADTFGKR